MSGRCGELRGDVGLVVWFPSRWIRYGNVRGHGRQFPSPLHGPLHAHRVETLRVPDRRVHSEFIDVHRRCLSPHAYPWTGAGALPARTRFARPKSGLGKLVWSRWKRRTGTPPLPQSMLLHILTRTMKRRSRWGKTVTRADTCEAARRRRKGLNWLGHLRCLRERGSSCLMGIA